MIPIWAAYNFIATICIATICAYESTLTKKSDKISNLLGLKEFMTTLTSPKNAVVLLSGGLDSVTCLYWAKAHFDQVTAVSFNYGQRHNSELNAAKKIADNAAHAKKCQSDGTRGSGLPKGADPVERNKRVKAHKGDGTGHNGNRQL